MGTQTPVWAAAVSAARFRREACASSPYLTDPCDGDRDDMDTSLRCPCDRPNLRSLVRDRRTDANEDHRVGAMVLPIPGIDRFARNNVGRRDAELIDIALKHHHPSCRAGFYRGRELTADGQRRHRVGQIKVIDRTAVII